MISKEECIESIKKIKAKSAIETSDENVVATIHLMNTHGIDINAAFDQSSRSNNDHGIDAWYFDEENKELFIYQSKLTESKSLALKGFRDLNNALNWLKQVIVDGYIDKIPNDNHCLFNLYTHLSAKRNKIKKISFILISLFNSMELEDAYEYSEFENILTKSDLNSFIKKLNGKLKLCASEYNLERSIAQNIKTYQINKIPNTELALRNKTHLDLAYIPLFNLVELYRQRGDILFDKNVRLSLLNSRDAKERLVHPMEETLTSIVSGKLNPNIFPFYHIGVTLAALSNDSENSDVMNIEAPSIINGCQTIVIANEFLRKLEKAEKKAEIEKFKEIKVIAKVVIGTSNEELMEITNSNNRQNPIENWQLFSNEPIHIEIETSLKECGVFYERQKGKYDTTMKYPNIAQNYSRSNGTYIKVMDLAQIVALSRRELKWAAKPSDIFTKRVNHDTIFDNNVPNSPNDAIFVFNIYKALKRGLNNYLEIPAHQNSNAPVIFKKPMVRMHTYHLGILYYYQNRNKWMLRRDFSKILSKIANTRLIDDSQGFYRNIVANIKQWYTEKSDNLTKEISAKTMDKYFEDKARELGIDYNDVIPFTKNNIEWEEYFND